MSHLIWMLIIAAQQGKPHQDSRTEEGKFGKQKRTMRRHVMLKTGFKATRPRLCFFKHVNSSGPKEQC